jgi:chemotaxis protein MotB
MFKKSSILAIFCVAFICYSCGSSKKLEASKAEVIQLTNTVTELRATNSDLVSKNNELQKQVSDLTSGSQAAKQEFEKYKADCASSKERLQVLESALSDMYNNMQEVEKVIEEGMVNFAGKGVEVHYKDGFVYVDMQDNLLYQSGSSSVSPEGKKALAALADALNDYPKLKVIVIGNTDDKQFKSGSDNWSLSTERANGVVRLLSKNYQVDPMRLTAAGRANYSPIADNGTKEGRAKNRHTEIILNPNLDRIWENVQKQ